MQPMCGAIATLGVIAIYYLWRGYFLQLGRQRTLRHRVAFMLWAMAQDDTGDLDEVIEHEWMRYGTVPSV